MLSEGGQHSGTFSPMFFFESILAPKQHFLTPLEGKAGNNSRPDQDLPLLFAS